MSCLFIVDCLEKKETASFWRKSSERIMKSFADAEIVMVDAKKLGKEKLDKSCKLLVLVGDDSSFSLLLNGVFDDLQKNSDQTLLGFIPSKESAFAEGLGLPEDLDDLVALLKSRNHQPLDVARCHCLSSQNQQLSRIVLNDAQIRLPDSKLPFVLKGVLQWLKNASGLMSPKSPNQISLCSGGQQIYKGEYLFSFIALGSRLTDGPVVMEKRRYCQGKFRYFQLNDSSFFDLPSNLAKLASGEEVTDHSDILCKHFDDLELKALGEDNLIVIDGVNVGRLPATFTLLPKALRVVAPQLTQPFKSSPIKSRMKEIEALKPLGKSQKSSKDKIQENK